MLKFRTLYYGYTLSAFIAIGPSKDVFEYVVENHDVILSSYILKELREKLLRKLGFSREEYEEIEEILTGSVVISIEESDKVPSFSDKKDLPILDLCISVEADPLITGDKQIQKLKRIGQTKVISPSEFWNIEKAWL